MGGEILGLLFRPVRMYWEQDHHAERLGAMFPCTWSPRSCPGKMRPVESVVKPPRRNTKARRSEKAGLGTTTARVRLTGSIRRLLNESASIIAPAREGSQLTLYLKVAMIRASVALGCS